MAGAERGGTGSTRQLEPSSHQHRPESMKFRLLSGGLWALVGRVSMSGGSFLVSVLLARLMSPEEVGTYYLALSLVTVAAVAGRFGLEKTALSLVAQSVAEGRPAEARRTLHVISVFAAASLGLTGLLTWRAGGDPLTALFPDAGLETRTAALSLWIVYLGLEVLIAETFRGFGRIREASLFGGATGRILLVMALLCVPLTDVTLTLELAIGLTLAVGAVSLIPSGLLVYKRFRALGSQGPVRIGVHHIARVASHLFVANIVFWVLGQAGLWIVAAFRPQDEVALYALAARLVMLVGWSSSIVNAVVPPFISELYAQGFHHRLQRVLQAAAAVAGLPSAAVFLTFIFAGGPVLGLAFGPFYEDARLILAILCAAQLFVVWIGAAGPLLIMTGHQADIARIGVAGGCLSLPAALVLVHSHGAVGVAFATAAGVGLQQCAILVAARMRCGVWTFASPLSLREGLIQLLSTRPRR